MRLGPGSGKKRGKGSATQSTSCRLAGQPTPHLVVTMSLPPNQSSRTGMSEFASSGPNSTAHFYLYCLLVLLLALVCPAASGQSLDAQLELW